MNIFVDYHHEHLYYSLHLLFEHRLGWELYRPCGLDWFRKGFWKIHEPYIPNPKCDAFETVKQYLEIARSNGELINGVYHISVPTPNGGHYIQKAITFDKFLEMKIDIIVASYWGHELAYHNLVQKHKPNATYVRQIGNVRVKPKYCKNVLLATNEPMPPHVNYIKYYPEHHEDYSYAPPISHNIIKSFIAAPLDEPDINLFYEYEKALPDFTFKMHGILGRDGMLSGDLIPQAMKDSAFVWHVKSVGGGGFVPREAMACGRPVIVKKSYAVQYNNICADLYQDSVNCIDLDVGTTKENIEKIKYFSEPERHKEMCKNTADKFKTDVNFDAEAKKIQEFLNNLEVNK